MEFLSAFKEPAVIISLFFSLLLFLFQNQGRRVGDWIVFHLGGLSQSIRRLVRVKKWRNKKEALLKIYNPYEMQWQVVRTYSFMLLFAISITTYAILVAIGPLKSIGQLPVAIQYFIYSPVLVFEALWLLQREVTRDLIRASAKRVTSQFTSPAQQSRRHRRSGY